MKLFNKEKVQNGVAKSKVYTGISWEAIQRIIVKHFTLLTLTVLVILTGFVAGANISGEGQQVWIGLSYTAAAVGIAMFLAELIAIRVDYKDRKLMIARSAEVRAEIADKKAKKAQKAAAKSAASKANYEAAKARLAMK